MRSCLTSYSVFDKCCVNWLPAFSKLHFPLDDKPVTDKFISRFKNYSDLVNYARYSDDSDLLSKIEIVNQHGHDITKFISILKERCNHSMDTASGCCT